MDWDSTRFYSNDKNGEIITFLEQTFEAGMRLPYVIELDRLHQNKKIDINKCFRQIGNERSRFSQWKRQGVPRPDMLRDILGLSSVPTISPSTELMIHWACRLSIAHLHEKYVVGKRAASKFNGPLDLESFVFVERANLIARGDHSFNLELAEHVEMVHSQLPDTILIHLPIGQDLDWFIATISKWHHCAEIVFNYVQGRTIQPQILIDRGDQHGQ